MTAYWSTDIRSVEVREIDANSPSLVLYWIGGLYHGPTFRRTLHEAYGSSDTLDLQRLDWRWTALLCTYEH